MATITDQLGGGVTPKAYSPEYYNLAAQNYMQATDPLYQREQARLQTALGGKGALMGTPFMSQLGQLGQQRMSGLQQTLSPLMMQGAQWNAQLPLQEAQLTGMYQGNPTLAMQQWQNLSPWQKEQLRLAQEQKELGYWQAGGGLLGNYLAGQQGQGGGGGVNLGNLGQQAGEWLGGKGSWLGDNVIGPTGNLLNQIGSGVGSFFSSPASGVGSAVGGIGSALGTAAGYAAPVVAGGQLLKTGLEAITGRPMTWGWERDSGNAELEAGLAQKLQVPNAISQKLYGGDYTNQPLQNKQIVSMLAQTGSVSKGKLLQWGYSDIGADMKIKELQGKGIPVTA